MTLHSVPIHQFAPCYSNELARATQPSPLMAFLSRSVVHRVMNLTPIIITGPSGCGKSTLLDKLFTLHPHLFSFSVSHTTRLPRHSETHGKHYHFTNTASFEKMIENKEFVEFAQFSGNWYGTSKKELDGIKEGGRVAVLDVERQGVLSLKQTLPAARYVLIKPPDQQSLRTRLLGRGTETEESMQKRLDTALKDMKWAEEAVDLFDMIIINDNIDEAYAKLEAFAMSKQNN